MEENLMEMCTMNEKLPMIITISRQLGCGGAYIGQQLAHKLNIAYFDREILSEAAQQLSAAEEELEARDEKRPSFWQTLFRAGGYMGHDMYIPPQIFVPTERELFETEAGIIKRIADERSAVIIGRCGSHILRSRPNHTSVFLHADLGFRQQRIQQLYKVSPEEAAKKVAQSDTERGRYHRVLTDQDWTDARQYDLAIDTGKIGVDRGVQMIMQYLDSRKP